MKVKIPTIIQVSAGGVAYRKTGDQFDIALILVGENQHWQLPKGLVNPGETPETTALREVREETGIQCEMLNFLDKIDFWYISKSGDSRVRYHKFVHFYLLHYIAGRVEDHDHEVNDARWVEIDQAIEILTFENEKELVQKAKEIIVKGNSKILPTR